ncbi:PREDICTED: uncharacterized protein LOC104817380 [Tarenaya hassleriana]|uniref:uncharacterized protein LOC104817380 n=1 Tax=Tarenaya hassleriana TaxID=28532 RepID=UPI00053CA3FB|nr:PREDICTED: uncharacterized protein LOC104817380 [Tarenaya hassleriana]XP_010544857.1 PREDICTED: uncharacterized protein LOC104817380 [Tarenaya hassleriana]
MGSLSEEEDQFFDTREDITSVSDSGSEDLDLENEIRDSFSSVLGFDIWIRNPLSIHERRNKFLNSMGLSLDGREEEDHGDNPSYDRMTDRSGTLLASSCFSERLSTSQSSLTSDSRESMDRAMEDNLVLRIKNLDDGTEFIVDGICQDGSFRKLHELSSNRLFTIEEFERNLGISRPAHRVMPIRRDFQKVIRSSEAGRKRKGWLKRLGVTACVYPMVGTSVSECCQTARHKEHPVKVHVHRKQVKEFSALYAEQDLKGHDGPISAMKFSPNGCYLATAGEDGIVRVWQILECDRSRDFETNDSDPSYMYFTANDSLSEIAQVRSCKDKKVKLKSSGKMPDYKFVIFPENIFRIRENPIHEFRGHCGEVLAISWSKNMHILSSSVDKTVCLWQVGYDQCLKTFPHNDYVTCVEFNPTDDNYFISGSIDGKIRVWDVARRQVVDWTDVHEIVTAVSYKPDGKGGVIGTISGNCHFYTAADNLLSLYTRVCFRRKKKSLLNRITGFQFSPIDQSIVLVTSADSQVRIIRGVDVIRKFGGSYSSGIRMSSASFASDGKNIVHVGDGSIVHMWNHEISDSPLPRKRNGNPFECFVSENASAALLWPNVANHGNFSFPSVFASLISRKLSQTGVCSRSQSMPLPESFSKCSATWPEENLPSGSPVPRSEHKGSKTSCEEVLGSCRSWGTVIVTAGSDGRIRSYQNFGLPVRV